MAMQELSRRLQARIRRPKRGGDLFGRAAETVARLTGSAKFIAALTLVVTGWVLLNTVGPTALHLDKYPFRFLILILSIQASFAAPLILLSQVRQSARDDNGLQLDRKRSTQSQIDLNYLTNELTKLDRGLSEVLTRGEATREIREELKMPIRKNGRKEQSKQGNEH